MFPFRRKERISLFASGALSIQVACFVSSNASTQLVGTDPLRTLGAVPELVGSGPSAKSSTDVITI